MVEKEDSFHLEPLGVMERYSRYVTELFVMNIFEVTVWK